SNFGTHSKGLRYEPKASAANSAFPLAVVVVFLLSHRCGGDAMRAMATVLIMIGMAAAMSAATLSTAETKRVQEAAQVLKEIHGVPYKDIPQELWDKAACVIVVPGLKKAAFVFGGEYGKGLMSCRREGAWGAPVFMHIGKGSWGLQIGAQSIDLVL